MEQAGVERSGWQWRRGAMVVAVTCAVLGTVGVGEARRIARAGAEGAAAAPAEEAFSAALLIDAASGDVLFEKDSHKQWPPASMTKMMLMLLVAERVRDGEMHWSDPIIASRHASKIGGSQVYLAEGESFPLSDMMAAIIIHSANDASMAVAEAIGGTSESFVELMNERAKQLGMKDTVYQSPHGLPPGPGQKADLTSAFDLAILARELVKFPDIIIWTRTAEASFRNGAFTLTNTNHLVRSGGWIDGLKTGYYREAGFNVTATGQRDGLRLIAVILGVPTKTVCFDQAAKLLNKGMASYKLQFAVKKGDVVANDVPVQAGKPRFVRILAGDDLKVLRQKTAKRSFTVELALRGDLQAPLAAAAPVGDVIVKEDGHQIGRVPAIAGEAIEKQASLWERIF